MTSTATKTTTPSWAKVGARVRLAAHVCGPTCRVGTIVEIKSGGALVLHDRPAWTTGLFAGTQTLGWCWAELTPERPVLRLVTAE